MKWHFIILFLLFLNQGCNWINPPEELPAFLSIEEPKVCQDSICQTTLPQGLKAVWVYTEGIPVPLGVFGTYSRFPLPYSDKKKISLRAGVFENGISNFIKEYPFLQFRHHVTSGIKGKTDTLSANFTYFPDSLLTFPIAENFEGQDLQLEPFAQPSDSIALERSIESPYQGAYCGKIRLDAGRTNLQLQSTREFSLPGNGTEVWLELAYRGDVNLQAGLVSLLNGSVKVLNQNTILKSDDWTFVYLNFTSLASTYSSGTFRLWLQVEGQGKVGNAYLDQVRLIHFR